jgi:hypothetical protein
MQIIDTSFDAPNLEEDAERDRECTYAEQSNGRESIEEFWGYHYECEHQADDRKPK